MPTKIELRNKTGIKFYNIMITTDNFNQTGWQESKQRYQEYQNLILSQIETQNIADNECKKEVCENRKYSKELEYCSYCGKSGCNGNCY